MLYLCFQAREGLTWDFIIKVLKYLWANDLNKDACDNI